MRENDAAELAELAEPLRSRITQLLARAKGAVWITSGRRTTQEQAALRRAHCGPTYYDVWQKPASQCSPPTAIPGRSRHETGAAVDLGGDLGLVRRLARQLGLTLPVKGEPWHAEAAGGARQGLIPGDWPIDVDLPGPLDDILGGPAELVEDAVGNVLGALVDPLLEGAARIALVGVLVAGGVGLVVLGGVRGAHQLREANAA